MQVGPTIFKIQEIKEIKSPQQKKLVVDFQL
jgi:hypothetical protein